MAEARIWAAVLALAAASLPSSGATPAEQAQAVGILQSFVQTGSASQFDPLAVHEAIAGGLSAYLASYQITMLIMAAILAASALLSCPLLAPARQEA